MAEWQQWRQEGKGTRRLGIELMYMDAREAIREVIREAQRLYRRLGGSKGAKGQVGRA